MTRLNRHGCGKMPASSPCRTTTYILIAMLIFAVGSVACAQTSPPQADGSAPAKRQQFRVGTYDSRAVALAGLRSTAQAAERDQEVRQLQAQLKEAEAAGDTKRAQEIKERGKATQVVRHLQAFSTVPVDDVLAPIKDKLPTIAQEAGVDVIVASGTDYTAKGVEVVDVTDRIVKQFNPDERTMRIITEVPKHKPLTLLEGLLLKD
jgi:hypothetical protein